MSFSSEVEVGLEGENLIEDESLEPWGIPELIEWENRRQAINNDRGGRGSICKRAECRTLLKVLEIISLEIKNYGTMCQPWLTMESSHLDLNVYLL